MRTLRDGDNGSHKAPADGLLSVLLSGRNLVMGRHVFKRLSAAAWLVAVAILLGLAGTSQAQLPIGSMVGEQRPTADVWWNTWRYDQAPRAVIAPNMFGDVLFNRPLGFTTPTLGSIPSVT